MMSTDTTPRSPFVNWNIKRRIERQEADASVTGKACQLLRRHFPNVHRCDLRMMETKRTTWGDLHGLPDHGRDMFFVSGKGVLDRRQLLLLAINYGFGKAA